MKKLNNKGMTLVEIIVCFVIVVVIVLAMFKTINNYKDKQDIESYKSSISTYKATVTKVIWDDIIKYGGITRVDDNESNYKITFLSGDTKTLIINHGIVEGNDPDRIEDDSEFYIEYGGEKYKFPEIYNVQFNDPKVVEEDGMFHIYVGIYHPDLQIGNKYSALNIITPNVSKYYYGLGG